MENQLRIIIQFRVVSLALAALMALTVVPLATSSPAHARSDNPSRPAPECRTADGEQGERDAYVDFEDMSTQLDRIEDVTDGRVAVEVAGQTHHGRDLYKTSVGDGDAVLLITGSVHGNEHSGTQAILNVLEWLGGDSAEAQEIRENVTLVALPMYNADGAELDQRQTNMSWTATVERHPQLEGASIPWYYNANNQGYDLNRDFNPDLSFEPEADDLPGVSTDPGFFLNPESRILRGIYIDLQAEYGHVDGYADLHHMGPCNTHESQGPGPDEWHVRVAIDYPPLPPWEFEEGGRWEDYPNMRPESRQLNMAFAEGIEERMSRGISRGISRYVHPDERDFPGQTRSSLALNGTATALIEMPGQTQQVGNQMARRTIEIVENGIYGMLEGLSTGEVWELDDQAYYDYPAYWE